MYFMLNLHYTKLTYVIYLYYINNGSKLAIVKLNAYTGICKLYPTTN